jgi:hypothetical protein
MPSRQMTLVRHVREKITYVVETSWGMKVTLDAKDDFDAVTQFHNFTHAPHTKGLKKTLVKVTRQVMNEGTL